LNKSLKITLFGATAVASFGLIAALNSSAQSKAETIEHSAKVVFPISNPGDTIEIYKVKDANGKLILRSNSSHVKNSNDLFNLECKEHDAKKKKYGALSDELIGKIPSLNEGDTITAMVCFKVQINGSRLDKTKSTMEEIEEKAKSNPYKKISLIDKTDFISKHKLKEKTLPDTVRDKALKNQPDLTIVKITKNNLADLCFDENVVYVGEYMDPKPIACNACFDGTNTYQTPPCFSSLANSAYNPASQMPADARGQNVNAATLEDGLRPFFVSCIQVSHLISYYQSGTDYGFSHSEQTFRCLAYAAPQANLYHGCGNDYFQDYVTNFISTNMIRTISTSSVNNLTDLNPDHPWMLSVDRWAYNYPYPVICNGNGDDGYCAYAHWQCYNAINVGNVQHDQEKYYVLPDSAIDITANCSSCSNSGICNGHCTGGIENAANPPPRYGRQPNYLVKQFNCSACNPGVRGDRELPMLVAPGISPTKYLGATNPVQYPSCGVSRMSDPCIYDNHHKYLACATSGTSYSAPILNGIAACVISANSKLRGWPEMVRVVLLATAQNVDFENWSYLSDGRDGAGVVSGADAVSFAKKFVLTNYTNQTAYTDAIANGSLYQADDGSFIAFNVLIPGSIPVGKHLRIVLTWDSSPSTNNGVNNLSDLDLEFSANNNLYKSYSYDSNVELLDIDNNQVTPGKTYTATIDCHTMRIPSYSDYPYIYYAIGWTWVKDHADHR
jgi:hypothetical protein